MKAPEPTVQRPIVAWHPVRKMFKLFSKRAWKELIPYTEGTGVHAIKKPKQGWVLYEPPDAKELPPEVERTFEEINASQADETIEKPKTTRRRRKKVEA